MDCKGSTSPVARDGGSWAPRFFFARLQPISNTSSSQLGRLAAADHHVQDGKSARRAEPVWHGYV